MRSFFFWEVGDVILAGVWSLSDLGSVEVEILGVLGWTFHTGKTKAACAFMRIESRHLLFGSGF
jgi:hypothetical protein